MKLEEIMFTPIYDEKMLEIMDNFGMKIPKLDKKYELEGVVDTDSKDGSIGFEFREIDGYSQDGEPCLTHISIRKTYKEELPYNISFEDSYEQCCSKIGRKNDFNDFDDPYNTLKFWKIHKSNNTPILLTIQFTKEFESIKSILLNKFDEEDINFIIVENN